MIEVLQSKDTENKNEIWYKFQGESYDIKPVGEYPKNSGKYVANGSRFFENGTEILYELNGSEWSAVGQEPQQTAVLEDVTVTPSTSQQTVTAGEGYDGIGTVTVEAVNLVDNINVTPLTSQQTITAGLDYNGIRKVTVGAVTSVIDRNIVAGNIKKDVTILGVTGIYEGSGGGPFENELIGLIDGSIETLSIPAGTTSIRGWAFTWLENLNRVIIPSSVTEIDSRAFVQCTGLETIEIDKHEDEIDDAPWGADNANVIWLR